MGPVAGRYDSGNSTTYKFKGGYQQDTNDTLCGRTRYQMIAVTNLQGTGATNARMLTTTNAVTLTVASTGFTETSSFSQYIMYSATVFVALISFVMFA